MGLMPLCKDPRELSSSLLSWEDIIRKLVSANLKGGPHQTADLPANWSWTSEALEMWKIHFCHLSHQVCGIVLQQLDTALVWVCLTERSWLLTVLPSLVIWWSWKKWTLTELQVRFAMNPPVLWPQDWLVFQGTAQHIKLFTGPDLLLSPKLKI